MDRDNIRQPIATSVRAIDGLHTCGLGQRMGIFSGPGVGKSTLMSSDRQEHQRRRFRRRADRRARPRGAGVSRRTASARKGLTRCVVIVSTGDEPPLLRVRAAKVACTVAEYFRDQGKHVLLMMDSLTRLCQAQRQIGLAAHEPPATKGFPPSVFALLPEILERAGKTATGSITGFYTVLVEGRRFQRADPRRRQGHHRRPPLAQPVAGQPRAFPGDRRHPEHQPRARRRRATRTSCAPPGACCR